MANIHPSPHAGATEETMATPTNKLSDGTTVRDCTFTISPSAIDNESSAAFESLAAAAKANAEAIAEIARAMRGGDSCGVRIGA